MVSNALSPPDDGSFFPAKPLGCYGDGGAVFTQDDEDAALIRSMSLHGRGCHKYENVNIGVNSRLDTIQAAILIEKIKIFPTELIARRKVAKLYHELLGGHVDIPLSGDDVNSAWALYTIRTQKRDLIKESLRATNVPSVVYYPIILSQQLAYTRYPVVSTGLEVSSMLSESVLSIPMHPYLKTAEIAEVSTKLIDAIKKK